MAKLLEFQHHPCNEYTWRLSFRIDWFDLLAVQGTLKNLLQHHSLKASVLWCSAFFMVQFSHPYMTTGKTIALTIQTFVGKVMSLLFNMLSRFVIAFSHLRGFNLISPAKSPLPHEVTCPQAPKWGQGCCGAIFSQPQSPVLITMLHKLESRLPGEISITSDMQMTPPLWQKVKRN